ncbi:MAG TPA: acyl-CoA dehydrogenase family protein, partial [Solirubrobacteraceae bacterium]|nr:acyl-CoA dehydrogenase family protein [Solirubrobacteraceae bacterium]
MRRNLYEDVHEDFRASFRTFLEREVLGDESRYGQWEREGIVPRSVFARAGEGGFLGMAVPEAHGGAGAEDFRFNLIIGEETQ